SSPDPIRTSTAARSSEILLLASLAALLLDTFAPWQRVCVSFSTPLFKFGGCLSANAWSGNASGFGVAAGVCTILACLALVLRLAGALEREPADWLERVLVFAAVATASVKWLSVIGKAASVGAWLGLVLLFVV